ARVRCDEAHALEPRNAIELVKDVVKAHRSARTETLAVGVDRLAEKRDLLHAVGNERAALIDDLAHGAADLRSARAWHDAVRAGHVAAAHDGDVGLVRVRPEIALAHEVDRLLEIERRDLPSPSRLEDELGDAEELARSADDPDPR